MTTQTGLLPKGGITKAFLGLALGVSLVFALVPMDIARAVDCWCRKPDGACEHHAASSGVTTCGSAPAGTPDADRLTYCNNYCASRGGGTWRAANCDSSYIDRTESGDGSCPRIAISGEGNIQCSCVVTTQLRGGTATEQLPVRMRGDSESAIEGGPCQELHGRIVDALNSGGGVVEDSDYEIRDCQDLSIVDEGAFVEGGDDVSGAPVRLYNPLGSDVTVAQFIGRGVRAVVGVVGAVALLMFIYGGIVWMTAGGAEDRVKSAKNILKNSFIGILLIFFSYTIISIFFSFLSA